MSQNEIALNAIYNMLWNGAVFGHDRINWRNDYPEKEIAGKAMFTTVLYKDYFKPIFKWSCYGSSANKATKKDLNWLIRNIFKCTPCEFLNKYMTRKDFIEKYGREY